MCIVVRIVRTRLVAPLLAALLSTSAFTSPQGPATSSDTQREAMKRLAFLMGRWSGPASVAVGPGEPMHLTQTEDVQTKLGGLVMTIEGTSRDAAGKIQFQAFATVAYDEASKTYRFRSYSGGHYLDTELTVEDRGFSWTLDAGPAHIVNHMEVGPKGEWVETSTAKIGAMAPRTTVQLRLKRRA